VPLIRQMQIDYVLVDLSPAISSINQSFFMSSSHFIVPCNPDYFCSLAIDSLSEVLPRWAQWPEKALQSSLFEGTAYPIPSHTPLFLGTINQRFRPRYGSPASAFKMWIDRINDKIESTLAPVFKNRRMLLNPDIYKEIGVDNELYNLANISDFNSLIARSQDYNVPIYELTDEQLETKGNVLENMQDSRDDFRSIFEKLANSIVDATKKSGLYLTA
jgi:chromosome partitioning protein